MLGQISLVGHFTAMGTPGFLLLGPGPRERVHAAAVLCKLHAAAALIR